MKEKKGIKLRIVFEIAGHCLYHALRHPRTKILQDNNPVPMELSPIPWWGCVLVLVIGIASWITASLLDIPGLPEIGQAMVWVSLTHVFDMSWYLAKMVQ